MTSTIEATGIPFILDKIKWINLEKVDLTEDQQKKLNKLPREKRNKIKKEILSKREKEKEFSLRAWTLILEEKIINSGLPRHITTKILELIPYIRNNDKVRNIGLEVENLKTSVEEINQKNAQKEVQDEPASESTWDSIPFVQVQYTKERFEKATKTYFENKILPDLVMAAEKPIVPVEPKREYPKKQGDQYPKAQIELEQKHENDLMDLLVKEVQKAQAEGGKTVQTTSEITNSFNNMIPIKQKAAIKAIKLKNPELVQKQEMEEKIVYEAHLKKNIERQLCKKKEKEIITQRRLEKEAEKAIQNYFRDNILSSFVMGQISSNQKQAIKQKPLRPHFELAQKNEEELLKCFVKKVQKQQKKAKAAIQTPAEILSVYKKMSEEDKAYTLQTMLSWNPQLIHPQENQRKNTPSTRGLLPKTNIRKMLEKAKDKKPNNKTNGLLSKLKKAQKKTSLPDVEEIQR